MADELKQVAKIKAYLDRLDAGEWVYDHENKTIVVKSGDQLETITNVDHVIGEFIVMAPKTVEWFLKKYGYPNVREDSPQGRIIDSVSEPKKQVNPPPPPKGETKLEDLPEVEILPKSSPINPVPVPMKSGVNPTFYLLAAVCLVVLAKQSFKIGADYTICEKHFKDINPIVCAVSGSYWVKKIK